MCNNSTESSWAMWAKLSVGWLLCRRAGACTALKGPVTSDAFSCCLQCQRTLAALQEPILVLMTPARLRLTLDYQAVAALPYIWLCLRAHPSPGGIRLCVGTGAGAHWSVPSSPALKLSQGKELLSPQCLWISLCAQGLQRLVHKSLNTGGVAVVLQQFWFKR